MWGRRSRFGFFALTLLVGAVGASSLDRVVPTWEVAGVDHHRVGAFPDQTWAEVTPSGGPLGGLTSFERTGRHPALASGVRAAHVRDRVTRRVVRRRAHGAPHAHIGERLLGLAGHPATAPPES
jgi:hypothetical protein